MKLRVILSILITAAFCTSCTSGGSSDGKDSGGGGEPVAGQVNTNCGVVSGGKVDNPAALADGIQGTVKSVSDGNVLIVSIPEEDILVRLLGVRSISAGLRQAAIDYVKERTAGEITFFPAATPCRLNVPGGGIAAGGTIITAEGTSLAEDLIQKGFVQSIDTGGACGEALLASCLDSLKETAPAILGTITDFLWKPGSDGQISPGKLVVLVNACNADIVVNGEHLPYDGPSSGRCSLGRSTKPGCAYGSNIKVEVFDKDGRGVYAFPDGNLYYMVHNGCSRQEFKN